jgi:hypothetical protein
MEGFLPLYWCAFWYALALSVVASGGVLASFEAFLAFFAITQGSPGHLGGSYNRAHVQVHRLAQKRSLAGAKCGVSSHYQKIKKLKDMSV